MKAWSGDRKKLSASDVDLLKFIIVTFSGKMPNTVRGLMISKMWVGVTADKDLIKRLERLRLAGAVTANRVRDGGDEVSSWSVNRNLMADLLGIEV
jgi:hypothetical protein